MSNIGKVSVLFWAVAALVLTGCGGDKTDPLATDWAEGAIEAQVAAGDQDVDVEMNTKDDSFSMKVTGEEGGMSITAGEGTKLPENMPKDVPVYPGIQVQMATSVSEKEGIMVQGLSTDAIEKVTAFYKKETADKGWAEAMSMNMAEGQQMLNYTKEGRILNVMLIKQDDGTQISVTTAKE
ncbi:MAG: hypothetical protein IT368_09350 [Candidatus Hydrogenedentes bacterium]|nr:hypothetical protein [Candidatus Hydrogenedentota bacterium]